MARAMADEAHFGPISALLVRFVILATGDLTTGRALGTSVDALHRLA